MADLYDLGEVQAVNEDDIRAAIDELNRSTATISKQTEALRQQQDALSRLVKKRDEAESQRHDWEDSRLNKTKLAIKKLAFEVNSPPHMQLPLENVRLRQGRIRSTAKRRVSSIASPI